MADATELEQATGTTMADLASAAAERFGDKPAIRQKAGDSWEERSYAQVGEVIDELAQGLIDLGLDAGERACILANTRPEWVYASFAISGAGGVVVPIYPTNSPKESQWVAGDSEAKVVFCEDADQAAKIAKVRDDLPSLEHVVVIEGTADGAMTLDELRERGRDSDHADELAKRREGVSEDDPYTIIYTSGTTGNPKGVVLTHANAGSVSAVTHELDFVTDEDAQYLYLPLAHVFALICVLGAWDIGAPIIFFGGNTKEIVSELSETQPSYFPSVPRIFEKIYTLVTSNTDGDTLKKAVEVGMKVRKGEAEPDDAFNEFEEKLYKNVRAAFGGKIRQAVTGAAPIAPDILQFFYACGVTVLEGWGLTETTGIGCVNTPDAFKFGTVGRAAPGIEVKAAEDGELLMKGPNVFKEYWNNEKATKETFTDDGWFRTGDVGEIDDEGFVKITGRMKDIIITAGGKNLTPSNIENELKQSRWISQAVMHGDRRPFPVALITLDEEEIVPWAKDQGLPTDIGELASDDKVRELIQACLDEVNSNHAQVAQIKKFTILDHDLSQETGELTPTLKVKRNVVNDKYADLFEKLYSK
jgi:long-chain acyl-CoA synthetase